MVDRGQSGYIGVYMVVKGFTGLCRGLHGCIGVNRVV